MSIRQMAEATWSLCLTHCLLGLVRIFLGMAIMVAMYIQLKSLWEASHPYFPTKI